MPQDPKISKKPEQQPLDNGGSNDGRGKGPQAPPPVRMSRSLIGLVFFLGMIVMLFMVLNSTKRGTEVDWDQFSKAFAGGYIKDNVAVVMDDRVLAEELPWKGNENHAGPVYV